MSLDDGGPALAAAAVASSARAYRKIRVASEYDLEWMRVLAQGWMTRGGSTSDTNKRSWRAFPRKEDMDLFVRTGEIGWGVGPNSFMCGVPPVLHLPPDDNGMDVMNAAELTRRAKALVLFAPRDVHMEMPLGLLLAPSVYKHDRAKHILQAFGNLDLRGIPYAHYVKNGPSTWLLGGEFVPLSDMREELKEDASDSDCRGSVIQTLAQLRDVAAQRCADSIAVLETNAMLDEGSHFLLGSRIEALKKAGFKSPLAVLLIPKAITSVHTPHWKRRLDQARRYKWNIRSDAPCIVLLSGPARYALDFEHFLPNSTRRKSTTRAVFLR